jgi:hypothetical protein
MGDLLNIILEANVIKKDVYKDGTQHEVYRDHKDSGKIFKVVKPDHPDVSKQSYNWIKIFKENPEYFPIVYKSTDRGASLEKLDYSKANKEFNEIEGSGRFDLRLGRDWFQGLLKDIAEGDYDKSLVEKVGKYFQSEAPEMASAFKRFINLMIKLQPINHPEWTLDAHAGNFGYSKNGKLKMLDI